MCKSELTIITKCVVNITAIMHLSIYSPTPFRLIWGNSGDLTHQNVKCPIVGRNFCAKSPLQPEGGGGGGGGVVGQHINRCIMTAKICTLFLCSNNHYTFQVLQQSLAICKQYKHMQGSLKCCGRVHLLE